MEIPPEGRHHESERERLCLLQSHRGRRMVKKKSKDKEKKKKTQEQELANSFYPVRRHFNILPYPVTGFVSGNFCRVFENSRQTQRTVRYCLKKKKKKILGVLERHSTSLAGWKTYRGRNSLRTERSLSFLGFFCASSRRLVHFLPREYSLESKCFTSCRCSGPERPDRPHLTGSRVIYCNPVDAQNTFTSNCSWLTELKSTSCLLSSPVLVPPVTIAAFRRTRKSFWPLISFLSRNHHFVPEYYHEVDAPEYFFFFFLIFYVVKSLLF